MMQASKEKKRERGILFLLCLCPIVIFLFSLSMGRYPVSIDSLLDALKVYLSGAKLTPAQTALIRVRLPRTLVALMVGAALSMSGAVYQGLFKNPVVSPDLLGASQGASLGAAFAILVGVSGGQIQLFSFFTGLLAVILVGTMNRIVSRQGNSAVNLILCGMLISSLFNAALSFIKFTADTNTKLPEITFWLMGSLASTDLRDLHIFWLFLPTTLILLAVRWKVNLLSLGDEEARMLGVHVRFYRLLIIGCATALTSLSVSVSGNIGWIGLVVPHLARMIVGSNYGKLLPASLLLGSSFMLLVDTVARVVLTVELPLGILTAVIGAPFFFILLLRNRRGFI